MAVATILMAGATLSLAPNMPADAAPPPLILSTTQDAFHPPHTPPTGTFTATGLAGCPSGTYADTLVYFTPPGTRVVVDEHYTCLGGATFTARLALHIAEVAPDGTQAVEGTWRIVTSDTGLAGSGNITGTATGCAPVGAVFADCTGGSGLVVGQLK
ncbi:MAG: hypothetical protein M3042_00980 [Actinomycetota bacterium]|nr:hypothetical protein [Actinomycetota bacterium]